MRRFVLFAPALFAACSTAPAPIPVHGVTPGHKCEAAGTDQFIGKKGTS